MNGLPRSPTCPANILREAFLQPDLSMTDTPSFSRAAVAAPHRLVAEAGRAILAEGGNAIEAMIAMAAAIAVVYPHMNSIGGDGFWLIAENPRRVRAIEGCGFAGRGAAIERHRERGAIPSRGPEAALTVPGAVDSWARALELSVGLGGKLPLSLLLDAAIRHARDGYAVSPSEARTAPIDFESLKQAPGFAATYLAEGKLPEAGATRKAPLLAETLSFLAHAGLDDFYRGDVGREIAADLERIGAPIARDDLRAYRAHWREPLSLRVDGATIFNTPPPTQGLASLVLLGLFERLNVARPDDFAYFHALIEASRRALAIRDRVCTDFDHLREDPADFLSAAALDREAESIDKKRAAPWPARPDAGDTIWMGAIDAQGRAVSFIQSLYWEYGSGCVLPATGILVGNRGLAFSLDPNALNPLRPGRRPIHTLNPPLAVFDDGRLAVYGSMGGDGQPQFQAQILTRYRFGQDIVAALAAPRVLVGRTWGAPTRTVKLEGGFDETIGRALAAAGHPIEWTSAPLSDAFGHAGMIVRDPKGALLAAHDPRSDGGAAGL
jgi:gamma-glutamyltranspeptidase/glutathione hydrolase